MHLHLTPIRQDTALSVTRQGDTLVINGETFDFADLPDNHALPGSAIISPWFAGPVTRKDGTLHVTLFLPHGADAPRALRFPETLVLAGDGPVALPAADPQPETPA